MSDLAIRRLNPDDAPVYRALMLQAYAAHPDAFTSSAPERAALPLDWWRQRLSTQPGAPEVVLGAWASGELVGAVGLVRETRDKTRHKAKVSGMIVAPHWRGRGLGRQLMQTVIDFAAQQPELSILQLTVTQGNRVAEQLYASLGFATFGIEPDAVAVAGGFVAKMHMFCRLVKPTAL